MANYNMASYQPNAFFIQPHGWLVYGNERKDQKF